MGIIAFFFITIIWLTITGGGLTFLEICILKLFFKIENLKYIKLLKILEIVVIIIFFVILDSLKIPIILFFLIYFVILIYDFYKKKIDIKNFIINFIFLFVDLYLMNLAIKITSQKLPYF